MIISYVLRPWVSSKGTIELIWRMAIRQNIDITGKLTEFINKIIEGTNILGKHLVICPIPIPMADICAGNSSLVYKLAVYILSEAQNIKIKKRISSTNCLKFQQFDVQICVCPKKTSKRQHTKMIIRLMMMNIFLWTLVMWKHRKR